MDCKSRRPAATIGVPHAVTNEPDRLETPEKDSLPASETVAGRFGATISAHATPGAALPIRRYDGGGRREFELLVRTTQ